MRVLDTPWLRGLSNQLVAAINSAVAMSPDSQKHLKHLQNASLKVNLTGLNQTFFWGVKAVSNPDEALPSDEENHYQIQLIDQQDKADVCISGSPLAMLKLLTQKEKAILFQRKELSLEGDSIRIQQILAFINSLKIDWEGLAANMMGDVPAHFLGNSVRSGLLWGWNVSQALLRDAEEYIKYELRLLPDKRRAQKQFDAIKSLSSRTEALGQRINTLLEKQQS